MQKQTGITLIALIITIIIMLILVGVTVNTAINGGLFDSAKEASFKTEMTQTKEAFEIYAYTKAVENLDFELATLNAGENLLTYNTKPEEETGNIYTVLANAPEKYIDNFEVIKGELIYYPENEKQQKWAQEVGIKVSPYIIENGVLLSANANLALLDENTGTLVIPSKATTIAEGAFANTEGIKKIIIPSTVKEIQQNAFRDNTEIEEIEFETRIENGVEIGTETIGNFAFYNCTNLKSIELPNTVKSLGESAFRKCSNLSNIVLSSGITTINTHTFSECTSLKSIIIPEGVTKINNSIFSSCTQLQSISLPKSLNSIESGAFTRCSNLTNIEIAEGNNSFAFSESILFNSDKTQMIYILPSAISSSQTTFTVPRTVTTFNPALLTNFRQITKVIIPASVTSIPMAGFTTNITEIEIDENNPKYLASDGKIYNKDKTTLYFYYQNASTITSIELEENITRIEAYAFNLCSNLQSLSIGKNVSYINHTVFEAGAKNKLEIVKIDEENPYYTSEGHGIYNKDKTTLLKVFGYVTEFDIPYGVEKIGGYAFSSQTKMTKVSIPNTVTTINSYAFASCTLLEKIEIPNSVQTIGANAFSGSSKLTEIIIDKEKDSISGSPWGATIGTRAVSWLR